MKPLIVSHRETMAVCLSCDEEIPGKRLTALPWAKYCVPCQEQIGVNPLIEERPFRLASYTLAVSAITSRWSHRRRARGEARRLSPSGELR